MKIIKDGDSAQDFSPRWTLYAFLQARISVSLLNVLSPFTSLRISDKREAREEAKRIGLRTVATLRRTNTDDRESNSIQFLAYLFLFISGMLCVFNTLFYVVYESIATFSNEWVASFIKDGYFPLVFALGFIGAYYLHVGARLEQQENKILEKSPSERVLFERRDKPTNKFTIFMGSLGFLLGCGLSAILMFS